MPRHDRMRQPQSGSRARIAATAARLLAEGGFTDFAQAKKKAIRQLGLPENSPLPDNAEVEEALRAYQELYQGDEQQSHLRLLREAALEAMELLADFNPYLTGSVLDGTAGEYSDIDILLFADSAKEVEIFLLNRDISFEHAEPQNDRIDAVLVLETEVADVRLAILEPNLERVSFKTRDGRVRERARPEALRELMAATAGA